MTTARTKIIRDTPSDQDEFHGEGHKRTATALALAVEQFADRDGAIGLEGQWGAGKSTVINLAEKHFREFGEPKKNRHLFTFDLWVHQPELLKLAFLEEFITWAGQKKFLTTDEVKTFLEKITDREITTHIENKRQFSAHGILFILLAPFLPIAYTWLSPLGFGEQSIANAALFSIGPFGISSLTLAKSAVAALFVIFASAVIVKFVTKPVDGWKAAFSAGARLFSKETDFDKITQHIRERNPTSEEFQSFFRKVVSAIQKKNDRVVIVFDNIDRLPSDVVAEVWSETRAIFSMRSRGEQPKNSNIVSIVPYDAAYVREVFEADTTKQSNRAEHLIKKTFDLALRVAPPLSTDWRAFLERKLDEAFPSPLGGDVKYKLFKLFDIEQQELGIYPTPRNIIVYINEIGAIWNQWGEVIPIPHIALYVIHRRHLDRAVGLIKNTSSVNARLVRVVGDGDWHRDLAALHFNVEPKHAYQILLGQDIEKIATGADTDAFVSLAGQPGFAEVFPDTAQQWVDQWATDGGDLLARLARNMSDTRIVEGQFRETWLRMEDALLHLKECDTSKAENYTDLALLVENLPQQRATVAAARLLAWFSQNLPKEEERNAALGREWFKFAASVHSAVSKICGVQAAKDLLNNTKLPMGANFAVGVCGESSKSDAIEFDSFQDDHDAAPLSSSTLELVQSDPLLLAEVVAANPWFISKEFWQEATNRVCDRLNAEKLDAPTRRNLLGLLSKIRASHDGKDVGKPRIAQLANDGTLISQAMRARAEGDSIAAARAVWLSINSTDGMHPLPNPGNHPHFGDLNSDHQAYTSYLTEILDDGEDAYEIARLVSQSGTFVAWMKFATSNPTVKVFASTIRSLVQNHSLGVLATKTVVQRFEELQTVLGSQLTEHFLEKFSDRLQYFTKHFSGVDSLAIPLVFLSAASKTRASGYDAVGGFIENYFESLNEEQWSELFDTREQKAMEHLFGRIEDHQYRPTTTSYLSALMKHTINLLDGNLEVSSFQDRWETLFDGLQKNTREKFARDVLLNLNQITTTTKSVENFLSVSLSLANELPFKEQPDGCLDHLVTPLVLSQEEFCIAFIRDHATDFAVCAKAARPEVRGRLEEALISLRQGGENQESKADEIADLLKVSLPKPVAPTAEPKDESPVD